MKKLLLIDGNSIMNRAFYGIMGSKVLTSDDGKYTNALYGFLAIMFKNMEEVNPDYMMIAFDSKTAANVRKQQYSGYKASRHGMPEELAYQMPQIKELLTAMNITYIELPDFEGDDIIGTAAKRFANKETEVYLLSGDRDLFQLIQDNIIMRIPRTKMGKTETEIYDVEKINEEMGLTPTELIDLKALMGDSSDEIPGCPGVGQKTATKLLQTYRTVDKLYEAIENGEADKDVKGKVRENLIANKELVYISKDIGKIKLNANITENVEDFKVKEWNKEEVIKLFKHYRFNRYLQRFGLDGEAVSEEPTVDKEKIEKEIIVEEKNLEDLKLGNKFIYYLKTSEDNDETKIIKKKIDGIVVYEESSNKNIYVKNPNIDKLKEIFENENIEKIGFKIAEDYVLLRELDIQMQNVGFDIEVAAYDVNPTNIKHKLDEIAMQYLEFDINEFIPDGQTSLFDTETKANEVGPYIYAIRKLYETLKAELEKNNTIKLFNEIEMPLVTVLGEMQFNGMLCDKTELITFGVVLKDRLQTLTKEIYELAGEEFNINSTQQLGTILFDKLGLPSAKKNKKGYSTDVDTLEKIYDKHDIVPKILEYRSLMKLNSTYVEGLIPYVNPKTGRIHSYFHQTITATGRISSTEPNLQNIPSHDDLGRNIKRAFKPKEGYVYIDADYSQIELRVLSHIAQDENMMNAFKNDEDIHREVASKVFNIPFDEVTKEQRSSAKAVNFGIVYGITGFGLAKQIGTSRKEAQEYIDSYLEKFSGVRQFMSDIIKKAEENGFVETLFGRRRYVPELKSKNFMVREFGKRVAMNTPIQGTAADIMKIAMNDVYKKLKEENLDARIVLQVHDELLIESSEKDCKKAKDILKSCMENAMQMSIPLKVELSEAKSWYDAK